MSQSKKKDADKTPSSRAADRSRRRRRTGFIIASVVIAIILIILGSLVGELIGRSIIGAGIAVMVIVLGWKVSIIASVVVTVMLAIVGIGYYLNYVTPFQRTIITVDDTSIRMDYFIKRTRLAGANPMSMLEALTTEKIIKLAAPRYGIAVSPEDITQELRTVARGGSETISESEFQAWYRQQLNESKLSDSEFREIVATGLMAARLREYLAERMPTVAEQVHLHAILLKTYEDAEKTRARWAAGEDFAGLAREVSLDEPSKEKGGDLGWFPRGVLSPGLDYAAFSLSTDNVSEPIPYTSDPSSTEAVYVYFLFLVSEKADAREVDKEYLPALKDKVFQDWLTEVRQYHKISYNFNSEINAWINWQLSKSQPSSTGQEPTQQ